MSVESLKTDINMVISVALGEARTNEVVDKNRKVIPPEFEVMRQNHQVKLDVLKLEYCRLLKKCKEDSLDPNDCDELKDCIEECHNCLADLNKDCVGELAICSRKFLDSISKAHSVFVEDLVLLASVYEIEENVDFGLIKKMFVNWYETAVGNLVPYATHAELLNEYKDDVDTLENQLGRHRLAAMIYDCKFVEDSGSYDYNTLPKIFKTKNDSNMKALQRVRDHLTVFSVMTFKCPSTWALVKFRKDGTLPAQFVACSEKSCYKDSLDILVNSALKGQIANLADASAHHTNRLFNRASEEFLVGDSTVNIQTRKASAAVVQAAIKATRAAENHRHSLEMSVAGYEIYMSQQDPATGVKRVVPTSIKPADVETSGPRTGRKRKHSSSSSTAASSAPTSSRVVLADSLIDPTYSKDEINMLVSDIAGVGAPVMIPTDCEFYEKVYNVNNQSAYVYGDDLFHQTMAERDFFEGEIVVVNWLAVKVMDSESDDQVPDGSYHIGDDVYVYPPDAGNNPNFPFSKVMCSEGQSKDQCNMMLLANSSLLVTKRIPKGSTMLAYWPTSAAASTVSLLADLTVLRVITSLILSCELKALKMLKFKQMVGDAVVLAKFPEKETIEQSALKVMESQALIENFLLVLSEDPNGFVSRMKTVIEWDSVTKIARPLSTTADLDATVSSLRNVSSSSSSETQEEVDIVFDAMTLRDCVFMGQCFAMRESFHVGYSAVKCCDRVFDLKEMSLAQRYLWFAKIQLFCAEVRDHGMSTPRSINSEYCLVQRQCDFMLSGRFHVPYERASEKSFVTFEYQYTDPLPVDFVTRLLDQFPASPLLPKGKKRRVMTSGALVSSATEVNGAGETKEEDKGEDSGSEDKDEAEVTGEADHIQPRKLSKDEMIALKKVKRKEDLQVNLARLNAKLVSVTNKWQEGDQKVKFLISHQERIAECTEELNSLTMELEA